MKFARDVYYVFWRDMKRFWIHKVRIFMSLFQPILWFILMGTTMNGMMTLFVENMGKSVNNTSVNSILVKTFFDNAPDYLSYVTSGIIAMTAIFAGFFGGTSVLSDRKIGFLTKMLSAPISRAAIPIGKILAIGVQIGIQVVVIILLAMLLGVKYTTGFGGVVILVLIAMLFGMGLAGISLSLGAHIKSMETLISITAALTMPIMFASSAMFPTSSMPVWLKTIAICNPVTYVVMPMRTLIYKGWVFNDIFKGILFIIMFTIVTTIIAIFQYRQNVD